MRVASGRRAAAAADRSAPTPAVAHAPPEPGTDHRTPAPQAVTSPAVGVFMYADGLGPGLVVSRGADLGFVEMLGVRHEVRAGGDGVVRHLVTESGEAVEYGQVLVELEPTPR